MVCAKREFEEGGKKGRQRSEGGGGSLVMRPTFGVFHPSCMDTHTHTNKVTLMHIDKGTQTRASSTVHQERRGGRLGGGTEGGERRR